MGILSIIKIVTHISKITGGNVSIQKMVLYFKLDDLNRLWLCFCTGLKLKDVSLTHCAKKIRVDSPIMR